MKEEAADWTSLMRFEPRGRLHVIDALYELEAAQKEHGSWGAVLRNKVQNPRQG